MFTGVEFSTWFANFRYFSDTDTYQIYETKTDETSSRVMGFFGNFSNVNNSSINPLENFDVLYSTYNIYINTEIHTVSECKNLSKSDMTLINGNADTSNKFQKMFELNLIDENDNNKQHKFNIGTYSKSENYDELNSYLGRPYVIYLTDYERILTYDKEENMNFQYGSYYYAREKNGKYKELSNRVYYRGLYNFRLTAGGPTRKAEDYYSFQYFFSFSGGNTQILYLHDPAYDYNEQIKTVYDILKCNYDQYIFSQDGNAGNWHIKGDHESTTTYTENVLTDKSTDKDFEDHIGEIRDPSKGNIQNKDDEKTEDTTNWGILDFLRNIYNALIGGGDDTSNATNGITGVVGSVQDKFAFKDNIVNNANEIKDYIVNTQSTHKYYLNINHKYLSGRVCVIDLSWYEPYKATVDAFICAFAYLAFIWKMFCSIPSLISGASASSYLNEISTYHTTGQGRSASIHNRKI